MKCIFLLVSLLFSTLSFSVCNSPISRQNSLLKPESVKHNTDMNALYAHLNSVSGDCINDSSITSQQIPDNAITTSEISDASITSPKLADGVLPSMGKLLRIRAFTTPGTTTWVKQPDTGFIQVQVVGGGGGYTNAGTYSSFGSHCLAGGGSNSSSGGAGGVATGGNINLSGGNGEKQTIITSATQIGSSVLAAFRGDGGHSYLGTYGQGGSYYHRVTNGTENRWGGGSGAYCSKLIQKVSLQDSESVVVGSGGTGPANSNPGKSGAVIVYEYGM